MKFPKKSSKVFEKATYGVAAFNGLVTQYWGDSYKEAEEVFYKSHTATHLYKVVGAVKEVIKFNHRRLNHPGAFTKAIQTALQPV